MNDTLVRLFRDNDAESAIPHFLARETGTNCAAPRWTRIGRRCVLHPLLATQIKSDGNKTKNCPAIVLIVRLLLNCKHVPVPRPDSDTRAGTAETD